uniref:NADH-ubiquinone oxidoreductase chain 5 n=1 Tax=Physa fontinalis TaxID=146087 RepID=A0A7D7AFG0_9GAST|nr:NADH dehydrogenase subunit 5 [Physa fontinalis]
MISVLLFSFSFMFMVLYVIVSYYNNIMILQFNLFTLNSINFELSWLLDGISCSFTSLVMMISGSVFMFSISYMSEDSFQWRFTLILLSFVMSMCLLIHSASLFTMLLGWDGLGITSFALIIYYSSIDSKNAGFKTLLINRIGDVLIMVSFFNFLYQGYFLLSGVSLSALFLIKIASLTKSAQYPFSSWLPAAMAAPTPVSALVHSSTLVTAGIYLLIRIIVSSGYDEFTCNILLFVGAVTSFLGGTAAVYENDLKKIIALSTLSQLGVMMFTIGMGFPYLALFHLFMHALFKALLFLAAGNILMMSFGCQDIRLLGGVGSLSPLTNIIMNVSCLSLLGVPFMSAYYSKHMIMEKLFMTSINLFSGILMLIATLFTMIYTFRLLISVSWSKNNNVLSMVNNSNLVFMPMLILGIFSIFAGKLYMGNNLNIIESSMIPNYAKFYISMLIPLGFMFFKMINSNKKSMVFSSMFYL